MKDLTNFRRGSSSSSSVNKFITTTKDDKLTSRERGRNNDNNINSISIDNDKENMYSLLTVDDNPKK